MTQYSPIASAPMFGPPRRDSVLTHRLGPDVWPSGEKHGRCEVVASQQDLSGARERSVRPPDYQSPATDQDVRATEREAEHSATYWPMFELEHAVHVKLAEPGQRGVDNHPGPWRRKGAVNVYPFLHCFYIFFTMKFILLVYELKI